MSRSMWRMSPVPLVLAGALLGFTLLVGACTKTPVAFEPGTLVGEPRTVSASGTTAFWVLPGPRRLAPNVFGTPQQPLGLLQGRAWEKQPFLVRQAHQERNGTVRSP